MKPNLLYLVHRIPYPPNKGDKIRSYHILRFLSNHYRVYLGAFIDSVEDWQYVEAVGRLCAGECFLVPLHPKRARLRSLLSFLTPPLTLPYYHSRKLQNWVNVVLKEKDIHRILVFSSAMAQYVFGHDNKKRVMDFVDVDSDKWLQYSNSKTWPLSWIYRRESESLLSYEKKIAQRFDHSFFVSKPESDLFGNLAPTLKKKVSYFSNGVDSDFFSPQHAYTNPYPLETEAIVFTGAMDYWANIDAVTWFAQAILPRIRISRPQAVFYIVGAKPAASVAKLGLLPGVKVVGTVPDTRPYLAFARVCVAPLRIARGVQNKVLEGMSMQKIVVTTPQAAEGIEAVAGKEFLVARDAEDFARLVVQVISGQATSDMAPAARARVLHSYNWDTNLNVLLDAFND